MNSKKQNMILKIITLIMFIVMVVVNALANILPINNITTGEMSDMYPNLFTPIGLTFSIWGVIYTLLAMYTIYQLNIFKTENLKEHLLKKINKYYIITSIINASWIVVWHYQIITTSLVLMIMLLILLIWIVTDIKKEELTSREKVFIKLPFSIYFGWITVATIANVTVLLVSLGWNGFGVAEDIWAVIVIITGLIIGFVTMLRNKDMAYGLVIIWAYAGIIMKHTSESGFDGAYNNIIITTAVCVAIMCLGEVYLFVKRRNKA